MGRPHTAHTSADANTDDAALTAGLDAARAVQVSEDARKRLDGILEREARAGAQPSLHRLANLNLWTKLRPGVRAFLEAVAARFELHIYTHGDAEYARAMAGLLDPGGRLFAERIISQVRQRCCMRLNSTGGYFRIHAVVLQLL